ncbi:FAD/NADP-binding domain-containing protein [Dacryopinax primogenitus]|uniref:FAD/NADP-binding domain-containing protein n=1 Tax=Dacryopinax primogenitus (strain DJM 731) TaxID=1858805 RepID=M5GE16_DACPD|nr:FAD/NADP-binding domain-containing protein [Dacryopinax primogenitus]EJU02893.1 FAD/NADP-binding domain-containing protein [Dacryopinax primogenitus]
MSGKNVIIIGCGIAGPVLSMLLQHKGFNPLIYERLPEMSQGGIAIGLSPQTLKVLNILGLANDLITISATLEETYAYSELSGEELGHSDGVGNMRAALGWPMICVARAAYSEFLFNAITKRGIPVQFNKKAVDVSQDADKVTVVFEDGTKADGDLLVGADGLHSTIRNVLFGKDEVTYMGLVQIGGFSPIPEFFKSWKPTLFSGYGNGAHFLSSPINDSQIGWSITIGQAVEAREDWPRLNLEETKTMVNALPVAQWGHGTKDILAGATFATKFGLYERPILPVWHKGRIVLVGDAAHPTSPHLGQGSNQALEDCYHLVRVLLKAEPWTDASLEAAFSEYEGIRIHIVQKSVGQAKKEGELRVWVGEEACRKRDEIVKQGGGFSPERAKLQMELVQGPFSGESEI